MTVRRGQSCDLLAIHALESVCFTDPWSEEALRNAFGGGITEFAVIEDDGDGACIGIGDIENDNDDSSGGGEDHDRKNGVENRTERNKGVFGYAMFSVILEDAELMSVAVAPEYRGRGAGRALMSAVLARAAERGASRCFLEVRSSNAPARALYTSLGFTEVRTIRSYYRQPTEDAVVMSRALP